MTRSGAMLAAALLAGCARQASTDGPAATNGVVAPQASVEVSAGVSVAAPADLDAYVQDGKRRVVEFFGEPFSGPFETRVFPHRRELDAFVAERWSMPPTECWMVAMGTGPVMVVLDPAAWRAEACEHDGSDEREVRGIVTHELVHVFHGQHGPHPELEGMDDAGWFVEGLAIYVAGQLDAERQAQARAAVAAGLPRSLAEAWSGKERYAVAGSLVKFVDETYGRATLKSMLSAASNEELLAKVGTSEERLLADWQLWVR